MMVPEKETLWSALKSIRRWFQAFAFSCIVGLGAYFGEWFIKLPWPVALILVMIVMMLIGRHLLDIAIPLPAEKSKLKNEPENKKANYNKKISEFLAKYRFEFMLVVKEI